MIDRWVPTPSFCVCMVCGKMNYGTSLPFKSIHNKLFLICVQENVYFVIYVLMSTVYFYLTLLLVPVAALFCDFVYQGWETDLNDSYLLVCDIHKDDNMLMMMREFSYRTKRSRYTNINNLYVGNFIFAFLQSFLFLNILVNVLDAQLSDAIIFFLKF